MDGVKRVFERPLHILFVDDNSVNLLIAQKMIQKFGGIVTTARSGTECISLVKTNTYDVVLMDIEMPDLTGLEVARELRKLNYANPIIALSANGYLEDVRESMAAGMNDHLQKPFTAETLFNKILEFVK